MTLRRRWPEMLVGTLVSLGLAAGLVDAIRGGRQMMAMDVGPAPDFDAQGQDGSLVNLDSFPGKVLLIEFFAEWCQPCVESMPATSGAAKYHEDDGVVFLAANTDKPSSERDRKIRQFFDRAGVVAPRVVFPSDSTINRYRAQIVPQIVIIDRNRRMQVIGPEGRREKFLRERLREALATTEIDEGGTPP